MKSFRTISCILLLRLFASCIDHDDFEFTGTVVGYQPCESLYNFGYAIALTSPDTIGSQYLSEEGITYENVILVFGADRMLHPNDNVSGKIYLDPYFSKSQCNYRNMQELPEAVFTELNVD